MAQAERDHKDPEEMAFIQLLLPALSASLMLGVASAISPDLYWANKIENGSFQSTDAARFCSELSLLCKDDVPIVINDLDFYEPPYALDDSSAVRKFFPDTSLVTGTVLTMLNPDHIVPPQRPVLPLSISRQLKINPESLLDLHRMFGITRGSNMSVNLGRAVVSCSSDDHTCVFSEQTMRAFVISTLGSSSPVMKLQTPAPPTSLAETFQARVLRVEKMSKTGVTGVEDATVACHTIMFPAQLYSCHSLPNTRAYKVRLGVDQAGVESTRVDVVAVCHADTSDWDPKLPALKALKMDPGKGTVCHWIGGSDNIWVKA